MNANLIHNWLRDPLFAPADDEGEIEVSVFFPVEIERVPSARGCKAMAIAFSLIRTARLNKVDPQA